MPRSQISSRPYDVPTSASIADVSASGRHRGTAEFFVSDGHREVSGRTAIARTSYDVSADVDQNFAMRSAGVRRASLWKSADSCKGIPRWGTHRTVIGGSSAGRRRWSEGLWYFGQFWYCVNIFYKISDAGVTHIKSTTTAS